MNFEHSEDRRMLADSLGRLLREQYALRDARAHRRVARRLEPRALGSASPNWARSACCSAKPTAATAAAASTSRSSSSSWAAGWWSSPSSARCWSAAPSPRPAATRSANAGRDHRRQLHRRAGARGARLVLRPGARRHARAAPAATAGCSTAPRRWWRRPKRPICCWSARAPRARPTTRPASRCSSCRPRPPASRCAATR